MIFKPQIGYWGYGDNDLYLFCYYYLLYLHFCRGHLPLIWNIQRYCNAKEAILPEITKSWSLDAPYDNQCPVHNGENCVAGCTATAMLQVIIITNGLWYSFHPCYYIFLSICTLKNSLFCFELSDLLCTFAQK